MKKLFRGICVLVLTILFVSCFAGCTYRKDGSVCQDLDFTFSFTDEDGEAQTINSTLTVYHTFAAQNSKRLVELVNDGYYNDTVAVFDYNGSYIEIGTYVYSNDEYTVKESDYDTVAGEFVNAGQSSRLSVEAGSVVMMRVPDTVENNLQKYNTAKVTFMIMLSSDSTISKNNYTVVGKIDSDSLEELQDMYDDLDEDDDDYSKILLRKRNNEGQVCGYDGDTYSEAIYMLKDGTVYYGDKTEILTNDEEELEDTRVTDADRFDKVVLPLNVITVKAGK